MGIVSVFYGHWRKDHMNRKLLRNDQWEGIKDLLPGKKGDPGKTGGDERLFIEAVLWIARTGSPWRDLLPAFGNWHSVYTRYSRWGKKGVWKRLLFIWSFLQWP